MFREPFRQVSEWTNEHLSAERKEQFREYRYAVEYHLNQAEQASQECSSSLLRFQWGISHDYKSIYITDLSPALAQQHRQLMLARLLYLDELAEGDIVEHVRALVIKARDFIIATGLHRGEEEVEEQVAAPGGEEPPE